MAALHVSAGYFLIRLLYDCTFRGIFYNKVALGLHYHKDIFYKIDPNCSISRVFCNKIAPNCTITGSFYNNVALWLHYHWMFYNKVALGLPYQQGIL